MTLSRREMLGISAGALAAMPISPALAQLRVDVSKGSVQPIDIALSPLAGANAGDNQLGMDVIDVIQSDLDGSGETDAGVAAVVRDHRAGDANHAAAVVDQRPAGAARVDRRVGLDQVFERVPDEVLAPQCTDDPAGHGVLQAERVADGEYDIASRQRGTLGELRGGQVAGVELDHGDVRELVHADQFRRLRLRVAGDQHADLAGAFDHVAARQDVAVRRQDDAGADAVGLETGVVLRERGGRVRADRAGLPAGRDRVVCDLDEDGDDARRGRLDDFREARERPAAQRRLAVPE